MKKNLVIDGPKAYVEALRKALPKPPSSNLSSNLALNISSLIYTSSKQRSDPAPDRESLEAMAERIQPFISRNLPIELIAAWGSVKSYGQIPSRLTADLADVLGISRFATIAEAVSDIYTPGMKVCLMREDVGKLSLSNSLTIQNEISAYKSTLDPLALELSQGSVSFIDESTLLSQRGISPTTFLESGLAFARLFHNYWLETEGMNEELSHEHTASYNLLRDVTGWQGYIHAEAREFYLDRSISAYPDLSLEARVWLVCVYLGNARMRHKLEFFKGSHDIPPLRAGFTPFAKGTPRNMTYGRVTYKVKDSDKKNHIPPWAGVGVFESRNNLPVPTVIGIQRAKTSNLIPINDLTINNLHLNASLLEVS